MADVPWLIDTNVLASWINPHTPFHAAAIAAIEKIGLLSGIVCYSSQNLVELWRVCTRAPHQNGFGMSPLQTNIKVNLIECHFRLVPDVSFIHEEWRRLVVHHSVSGVQVHDARLVATMQVHGVHRILKFNTKDFNRYGEVTAVHHRM